jgi:hypothetical protein
MKYNTAHLKSVHEETLNNPSLTVDFFKYFTIRYISTLI